MQKRTGIVFLLASAFAGISQGHGHTEDIDDRIFGLCHECHTIGPSALIKVGPPLNGVVGRRWASVEGYDYSDKLAAGGREGKTWTESVLNEFLSGPRKLVPGTKMSFPGLSRAEQRAKIIDYLRAFDQNGSHSSK